MPLVPSRMEDSMCYEIDYKFFAEQKKAQEARIKQEQRAGVIDPLLNEANKQSDDTKTEGTQDGTIRQQLIEQLMREIIDYDAEFRRDAGSIGAGRPLP